MQVVYQRSVSKECNLEMYPRRVSKECNLEMYPRRVSKNCESWKCLQGIQGMFTNIKSDLSIIIIKHFGNRINKGSGDMIDD